MKSCNVVFRTVLLLCFSAVTAAHASFSSIYIFGDTASTTTTNSAAPSPYYYGQRYCNGRVWVEVLAQRQGLGANSITNANWAYSTNNLSYYGHYSAVLVTNVGNFVAPAKASNCLFVVWVNNADFVGDLNDNNIGSPNNASHGTNIVVWTNAINQHLTNHFRAFTNLYAKGVRTLVAPNAVDIMALPQFNGLTNNHAFVRQRVIDFNTSFAAMIKQVASSHPGITIYVPDAFALMDDVLAHAANYGLTNALTNGLPIDVLETPSLSPWATNGPGTNYVFWDFESPTAKFQEVLADLVQQMISPVKFTGVTPLVGSNRLDVVNLPVGLAGSVLYATNLTQTVWKTNSGFSAVTTNQALYVYPTNSARFYKLKLPYQWGWP